MANIVVNQFKKDLMDGGINLVTAAVKMMLCNSTLVPNADDTFVDDASADDPESGEIGTVTNYTGGFAGSGRKTPASRVVNQDDANDRAEFDFDDILWTALGGAANDTITHAVLVEEITNDAGSPVLVYYDIADTTTNGSNFTLNVDAEGALQLA